MLYRKKGQPTLVCKKSGCSFKKPYVASANGDNE